MWAILALQSFFNYPKQQPSYFKRKLRDAMARGQFCFELCLEQHMNCRMLVFEHPAGAASWSMRAVQQMKFLEGIHVVKIDFCMLSAPLTRMAEANYGDDEFACNCHPAP